MKCACCEVEAADVMLRIEFADATDVSPWCMDCAADVVETGYGEVVSAVDRHARAFGESGSETE